MKTIKIFTTPQCVKCNATKRWLDTRDIAYETIDATADPDLADSIRALAVNRGEQAIMPLVEVHNDLNAQPIQWFDFRPDLLADHTQEVP